MREPIHIIEAISLAKGGFQAGTLLDQQAAPWTNISVVGRIIIQVQGRDGVGRSSGMGRCVVARVFAAEANATGNGGWMRASICIACQAKRTREVLSCVQNILTALTDGAVGHAEG